MSLKTFSALCLLTACVVAQETRGIILGRVLDPQGGAVAGAKVLVTNVETNTTVERQTNATGYYEANLLLPGSYSIAAESAGFKKMIRSGITLSVSQRLEVDLQLELGALAESVSVTAEAPMLDTNVVSSGRIVDRRSLMDLPVMGNNPALLVKMAPGVQHNGVNRYAMQGFIIASSEYYSPLNIGGNEWSIDGAPNNGSSRLIASAPYSDTVAEFKVESSNFDAANGHSTGVNVSMMTRSGTNAYHGTATEQYFNTRLNGTPFFPKQLYYRRINEALAAGDTQRAAQLRAQDPRPPGRSHNYAGTFSGPVVIPKLLNGRNKLFFFFSYAAQKDIRSEDVTNINNTIPTLAERNGDFSQLLGVDATRYTIYDPLSVRPDPARPTHFIRTPIPGNQIPAARIINPLYPTYVKFYPTPNNTPLDPRLEPNNNYVAAAQPNNEDYWSITNRVDYNHSAKHRFFVRWSYNTFLEDKGDWTFETRRGLQSNFDSRKNWAGTVDWTWTPSGSTVFDFLVSLNNFRQALLGTVAREYKPSDVGLPTYLDQKAGAQTILPTISVSGYRGIGRDFPNFISYRTFTSKASVSHVRGNHTVRGGFEARQQYRTNLAGGNTSGSFNFSNQFMRRNDDTFTPAGNLGLSWAAFMLGVPSGMTVSTNDSYAMHNPYYAWYVQDAWRLTRNLTLNFGLRLEFEDGPTERYNRMLSYFDPEAKLPITDVAQAAYAARPLAEVPASSFIVKGGSLYAGVGGVPRNRIKGQFLYLPKISLGWQFNNKMVLRGGYGVSYDTLNVLNDGPDQFGFSRTTSTPITTDFGMTWLAGDPANGISPLKDPFPVRGDGTRFNIPFRDGLGLMAVNGRGFDFDGYNAERSRVQRWRIGLQRQLTANMVTEIAYQGSWADRLSINQQLNALPEKYWADGLVRNNAIASDMSSNVPNPFYIENFRHLETQNPLLFQQMSTLSFFLGSTIAKNRLLRPYPNIENLSLTSLPVGVGRTHELQVTFERRMSKGFNLNASYSRLHAQTKTAVLNEFELPRLWLNDDDARPHRFAATGIFELPFGRGRAFWRQGFLNHVFGGWQVSATYEWQPGPLINFGNVFYYGDDVNDIKIDNPTWGRWFNTDNFEKVAARTPANYHRRVFPNYVDGLREDMTNQWNTNLLREFKLTETVAFQVRADALNLQNRSQFEGPVTNPTSSNFGQITTQTTATNRFLQFQARLRF